MEENVLITVTLRDQVTAALDQMEGSFRSIATAGATAADEIDSRWSRLGRRVWASAQGVAQAMGYMGAGFMALASKAAKVVSIEDSFHRMMTRIGVDADQLLGTLRNASMGLVSETELMQKATSAFMLIGTDAFQQVGGASEGMTKLLQIAMAAARATGQDVNYMFESIVYGIGRASPMILDNLGLTISLGDANKRMADALGVSTDALTKEQKVAAVLNEVLRKGDQYIQDFGISSGGLRSQTQQLSASMEDLTVELGKTFIPVMQKLLTIASRFLPVIEAMIPVFDLLFRTIAKIPDPIFAAGAAFVTLQMGAGAATAALTSAIGPLASLIPGLGALAAMSGPISLVIAALVGLAVAYQTNFLGIKDALRPVTDAISNFVTRTREALVAGIDLFESLRGSGESAATALGRAVETILTNLGVMPTTAAAIGDAVTKAFNAVVRGIEVIVGKSLILLGRFLLAVADAGDGIIAFARALVSNISLEPLVNLFTSVTERIKAMIKLDPRGAAFIKAFNEAADATRSYLQAVADAVRGAIDLFSQLRTQGVPSLQALIEAVTSLVGELRSIPVPWDEIYQAFSVGASGLVSVGEEIASAFAAGLTSALQNIDWTGVRTSLEASVAAIAAGLVAAAGQAQEVFLNVGEVILENINAGIILALPKLQDASAALGDALRTALSSIELGDIGGAIVDGILAPLVELGSGLVEALTQGFSNALAALKAFLGIGSPSALFAAEIGIPIVQGIIEGVRSAASQLSEALLGLLPESIQKVVLQILGIVRPIKTLVSMVRFLSNNLVEAMMVTIGPIKRVATVIAALATGPAGIAVLAAAVAAFAVAWITNWNDIRGKTEEVAERIKSGLINAFESLPEPIQNALRGVVEAITTFVGEAQAAFERLTGVDLSALGENISGALSNIVASVRQFATDLKNAFDVGGLEGVVTELKQKVLGALSNIQLPSLNVVLESVKLTFSRAIDLAQDVAGWIRDHLPEVSIEDLKARIVSVALTVGEVATRIKEKVSEAVKSIDLEEVKLTVLSWAVSIREVFTKIKKKVKEAVKGISLEEVKLTIQSWAISIKEVLTKIKEKVKEAVKNISLEEVKLTIQSWAISVKEVLTKIKEKVSEAVKSINLDKVKLTIQSWVTSASEIRSGVETRISEAVSDIIVKLTPSFDITWPTITMPPLDELIEMSFEFGRRTAELNVALTNWFTDAINSVDWYQIGQLIADALIGAVSVLGTVGVAFFSAVVGAWQEPEQLLAAQQGLTSALLNAVKGIAQGFYDEMGVMVGAPLIAAIASAVGSEPNVASILNATAELIIQGTKDSVAQAWEALQSVGSGIVDGIRAGIVGKWDEFKSFLATKIGELPVIGAMVLGERSPSAAFASIGEGIPHGLAVGINRGSPAAFGALRSMGNNLISLGQSILTEGLGPLLSDTTRQALEAQDAVKDLIKTIAETPSAALAGAGIGGGRGGRGGRGGVADAIQKQVIDPIASARDAIAMFKEALDTLRDIATTPIPEISAEIFQRIGENIDNMLDEAQRLSERFRLLNGGLDENLIVAIEATAQVIGEVAQTFLAVTQAFESLTSAQEDFPEVGAEVFNRLGAQIDDMLNAVDLLSYRFRLAYNVLDENLVVALKVTMEVAQAAADTFVKTATAVRTLYDVASTFGGAFPDVPPEHAFENLRQFVEAMIQRFQEVVENVDLSLIPFAEVTADVALKASEVLTQVAKAVKEIYNVAETFGGAFPNVPPEHAFKNLGKFVQAMIARMIEVAEAIDLDLIPQAANVVKLGGAAAETLAAVAGAIRKIYDTAETFGGQFPKVPVEHAFENLRDLVQALVSRFVEAGRAIEASADELSRASQVTSTASSILSDIESIADGIITLVKRGATIWLDIVDAAVGAGFGISVEAGQRPEDLVAIPAQRLAHLASVVVEAWNEAAADIETDKTNIAQMSTTILGSVEEIADGIITLVERGSTIWLDIVDAAVGAGFGIDVGAGQRPEDLVAIPARRLARIASAVVEAWNEAAADIETDRSALAGVASAILGAVGDIVGGVRNLVAEVPALFTGETAVFTNIEDAEVQARETARNLARIASAVVEAWNEAATEIETDRSALAGVAVSILRAVGDIVDGIRNLVAEVPALFTGETAIFTNIEEAEAQVRDQARVLVRLANTVIDEFQQAAIEVDEKRTAAADAFQSVIGVFSSMLDLLGQAAETELPASVNGLASRLASAMKALALAIDQAVQDLEQQSEGIIDRLTDAAEALEPLGGAVGSVVDAISSVVSLGELGRETKKIGNFEMEIDRFGEFFTSGLSRLRANIDSVASLLTEIAGSASLADAIQAAQDIGQGLSDLQSAISSLQSVIESIYGIGTLGAGQDEPSFARGLNAAVQNIQATLTRLANLFSGQDIPEINITWLTDAIGEITGALESVTWDEAAGAAMGTLLAAVETGSQDIVGAFSNLYAEVAVWIDSLSSLMGSLGDLGSIMASAVYSMADGIYAAIPAVDAAFGSLVDTIWYWIEEIQYALSQVPQPESPLPELTRMIEGVQDAVTPLAAAWRDVAEVQLAGAQVLASLPAPAPAVGGGRAGEPQPVSPPQTATSITFGDINVNTPFDQEKIAQSVRESLDVFAMRLRV